MLIVVVVGLGLTKQDELAVRSSFRAPSTRRQCSCQCHEHTLRFWQPSTGVVDSEAGPGRLAAEHIALTASSGTCTSTSSQGGMK